MNNRKEIEKKLRKIVEQEEIAEDVASWFKFFNEDPRKIPVERIAQHVKAALTGRPLGMAVKSRDTATKNRILRLLDEINDFAYPPKYENGILNKSLMPF